MSLRKGAWSKEEDELLRTHIMSFGVGKWCDVPKGAGLDRCRRSCRRRWLKHGNFGDDETELIIRLHRLLGNRNLMSGNKLLKMWNKLQCCNICTKLNLNILWSLIAGRLPGRTANDVKNYWNSYLSKKIQEHDHAQRVKPTRADVAPQQEMQGEAIVIKPTPWVVPKGWVWSRGPAAAPSAEEEPY